MTTFKEVSDDFLISKFLYGFSKIPETIPAFILARVPYLQTCNIRGGWCVEYTGKNKHNMRTFLHYITGRKTRPVLLISKFLYGFSKIPETIPAFILALANVAEFVHD
jgi:hypothetical protein